MKTAKQILIEKGVLIKGAKTFPLNLTRDTHIGTKRMILEAMEEYADQFKPSIGIPNEVKENLNP